MRIYLVVMDETEEAQTFNAFGGVQATIEREAAERAEVMANAAAGNIFAESGKMPVIAVRTGSAAEVVAKYLEEHGSIAALVLGAAASGGPGPLVTHFAAHAGALPCPLYVIPGGLDNAAIDRLAARGV